MYWETVSNDTFRICHLVQRFRDLVELPESMTVYTPDNCLHPGQLFTPRATVYTPDNCLHPGQLFTPRTTATSFRK